MNISEICINRPVFATVLSLIIVVLGIMFYIKLPLRDIPDINPPIISINANYDGTNASYMECNITTPIEKALRTIKNVELIQSESSSGSSNITITFDLETDIKEALSDVRSKIASISHLFPNGMKLPNVEKMDSEDLPSFWIVAKSDHYDNMILTNIIHQHTVKTLERIPSVGRVQLFGDKHYTMGIMPDPVAMYALKITPIEIENALQAQNKDYPAGYIRTDSNNYVLTLNGQINTEEDFRNVILRSSRNNGEIKLGQVAKVQLEPYDENVILRHNGESGIAIGLVKQSKSNLLELSNDVHKEFKTLQDELPSGITLTIVHDSSTFIKDSIHGVFITIIEALFLVMGVIYLFLQSPKIIIIPFVTIPVSLIGSFSFMYALGFSVNTFTLLAMTLAIGLVVDDAIVMLENIFRHTESGESPMIAAVNGSKEIAFAIITMTITLAAVYLPIGFVKGFVGKIFIEFAWTLALCVLVSGFVALTLTPMMASKMIGAVLLTPPLLVQKFQTLMTKTEEIYLAYLRILLISNNQFWIICAGTVLVLSISLIAVEKVFSPEEDIGDFYIRANGPEGSTLAHSDAAMKKAEQVLGNHKDVFEYFTITGMGSSDRAGGHVILKSRSECNKTQKQIRSELNMSLKDIPEMSISVNAPRSLVSSNSKSAIAFHLHTDEKWEDLDIESRKFVSKMEKSKIFNNISLELKTSIPTLNVVVDRTKAHLYGVPFDSIGTTLQYLIAGRNIGDFSIGGDTYGVTLRYDKKDKSKISDLSKVYLKTKENDMISLDSIAEIYERISIKSYTHYNGTKSIKISADLNSNYTVAGAMKFLDKMAYESLNKKIHLEYLEEIQYMNESNSRMLAIFGLALIFIYLVLSAQFESFIDPLIILCAVPFSIAGGVLALFICFDSLNLYSNIGLITLVGLITKNSIMIVEFANQLMSRGQDALTAAVYAAQLRFRPILMTTMATVFGSIPLVFASGAGSEARHSIGLVIVGGMTIGTLFTMFVIPVLYQKIKR